MVWSVYADPLVSLPDPAVFCPLTIGRDIELWSIRTWVVFFNQPTFTEVKLGVYSDLDGKPGQLLFESTSSQTLDSVQSPASNSSAKEIFFSFAQNPHLKSSGFYHICLTGSGYVFNEASFIAHKKAWPDPCYESGADLTDGRLLARLSYDVALIGREV